MMRIHKLVVASANVHKVTEIRQILMPLGIQIITQDFLGIPLCHEEPHSTFIENALHKAHHIAQHTDLPVLADDSGLCVAALNGAPGIHSARYAGTGSMTDNLHKLCQTMNAVEARQAYFYCALVLLRHAQDACPLVTEGIWRGKILHTPQGGNGFGYDAIFWDETLQKSAAELTADEKNRVSHRGKALCQLMERIKYEQI